MMRRVLSCVVLILACVALLALTDASVMAGPTSGGHSHGSNAWGGGGSSYYAAPIYAAPVYVVPGAVASPAPGGAFYYAPEAGESNAGVINVTVPANAEIWFNNYKTKLTGTSRTFVSPPLDPNQTHRYHVRVRWLENGQEVVQERDVPVAPGTQTSVQFAGLATASSR
jgi:uncharacterized protein (TIGR03000 family)